MWPSRNPNCQRYIDDPNYAWYGGQWMTLEGVERRRKQKRERYWSDPVFRVEEIIKRAANRNLRKRRELHGN